MENLEKIFKKYDIELSKEQSKQFDDFFNFLTLKNKLMNLTAITDENDVLFKHFLDSVLPQNLFFKKANVLDVGSGAGFPAIPLKIVRPDLNVVMLDSLQKRVNFLNEAISLLNLKNIQATHSRAEDFAKNFREKFDITTARAVAPLNTLLEYLLPLTKQNGLCIIYKSTKLDEELKNAQNALKLLGGKVLEIQSFEITEQNLTRNVLVIKKIKPTPVKYPRGKNEPKTKPL